ncbi:hypothetical protein IX321_000401 [Bacteroides pyogenes]|nr:hypothetical protein [Bacteroides pyogenes]MBR8707629.1 hypothetical protein [Bacteroides pyogenes]MBR8716716.1 hypothetical protein [Bacteroides pyogenes]MBR8745997.1 hypothetical protein [Bacteroides pyogenes]MBR8756274.1 hypothetical protein [Bacteroides pyogenes]
MNLPSGALLHGGAISFLNFKLRLLRPTLSYNARNVNQQSAATLYLPSPPLCYNEDNIQRQFAVTLYLPRPCLGYKGKTTFTIAVKLVSLQEPPSPERIPLCGIKRKNKEKLGHKQKNQKTLLILCRLKNRNPLVPTLVCNDAKPE